MINSTMVTVKNKITSKGVEPELNGRDSNLLQTIFVDFYANRDRILVYTVYTSTKHLSTVVLRILNQSVPSFNLLNSRKHAQGSLRKKDFRLQEAISIKEFKNDLLQGFTVINSCFHILTSTFFNTLYCIVSNTLPH